MVDGPQRLSPSVCERLDRSLRAFISFIPLPLSMSGRPGQYAGEVARHLRRAPTPQAVREALEEYIRATPPPSVLAHGSLPLGAAVRRLAALSPPAVAFRLLVDVWRPVNTAQLIRLGLPSQPFLTLPSSFTATSTGGGGPPTPLISRHPVPLQCLLQGATREHLGGGGSSRASSNLAFALTGALLGGGMTSGLATALLHSWAVWGPPSAAVVEEAQRQHHLQRGGLPFLSSTSSSSSSGSGGGGGSERSDNPSESFSLSSPAGNQRLWSTALTLLDHSPSSTSLGRSSRAPPSSEEAARAAIWMARGGAAVAVAHPDLPKALLFKGARAGGMSMEDLALSFVATPSPGSSGSNSSNSSNSSGGGGDGGGGGGVGAQLPPPGNDMQALTAWAEVFSRGFQGKVRLVEEGEEGEVVVAAAGEVATGKGSGDGGALATTHSSSPSALSILSPPSFHPLVDTPTDLSSTGRSTTALLRMLHGISLGVQGVELTGASSPSPSSSPSLPHQQQQPWGRSRVSGATLSALLALSRGKGDVAMALNVQEFARVPTHPQLLCAAVKSLCTWGGVSEAMGLLVAARPLSNSHPLGIGGQQQQQPPQCLPTHVRVAGLSTIVEVASKEGAHAQALGAWKALVEEVVVRGGGNSVGVVAPTPQAVAGAIASAGALGLVEDMYRGIVWVESGRGYLGSGGTGSGSGGPISTALAAAQNPANVAAASSATMPYPVAAIRALSTTLEALVRGVQPPLPSFHVLPLDERAAAVAAAAAAAAALGSVSGGGVNPCTLPFPPGLYHHTPSSSTSSFAASQSAANLPFIASLHTLSRLGDGDYITLLLLRELGRCASRAEEKGLQQQGSSSSSSSSSSTTTTTTVAFSPEVAGAFVTSLARCGYIEAAVEAVRACNWALELAATNSSPKAPPSPTLFTPPAAILAIASNASHISELPAVFQALRQLGAGGGVDDVGVGGLSAPGSQMARVRYALPRVLIKMCRRMVRVKGSSSSRSSGGGDEVVLGGGEGEAAVREAGVMLKRVRAILRGEEEEEEEGGGVEEVGVKVTDAMDEDDKQGLAEFIAEEEEVEGEAGGVEGKGLMGVEEKPSPLTSRRRPALTDSQVMHHLLASAIVKWTCQLLGGGAGAGGGGGKELLTDASALEGAKALAVAVNEVTTGIISSTTAAPSKSGRVGAGGGRLGSSEEVLRLIEGGGVGLASAANAGGISRATVEGLEGLEGLEEEDFMEDPITVSCDMLSLVLTQWPVPQRVAVQLHAAAAAAGAGAGAGVGAVAASSFSSSSFPPPPALLPARERGAKVKEEVVDKLVRACALTPETLAVTPARARPSRSPYLASLLANALTYEEYLEALGRRLALVQEGRMQPLVFHQEGGKGGKGGGGGVRRKSLGSGFGPWWFHKEELLEECKVAMSGEAGEGVGGRGGGEGERGGGRMKTGPTVGGNKV